MDESFEKPEGLDDIIWDRVLEARTTKMANEAELKRRLAILNEFNKVCILLPFVILINSIQYYDDLRTKDDDLRARFDEVNKKLHDFAQQRLISAMDLHMLLKLKQGQVEVEQAPFVTDYSECVFINKSVIEDYNTSIHTLNNLQDNI